MGQGIDLARGDAPLHAQLIDDQLLIVLLKRIGSRVSIPVAEVDATGRFVVTMNIVDRTFNFEVKEKN